MIRHGEPKAWRDTIAAGVDLPEQLLDLFAEADRLAAELAELEHPAAAAPSPVHAVLAGRNAGDAQHAAAQAATAGADLEQQRQTLRAAADIVDTRIRRWIDANRDALIVEHLRPAVEQLLADARPLAVELERFAPAFDPATIAGAATAEQLEAWRRSRELAERFAVLLEAWRRSWQLATASQGGRQAPGYLRPDAPGGLHAWERPRSVDDVNVRDGRNVELLAVVRYADVGGYRLAGIREVVDLDRKLRTEQPWIDGERRRRFVLLPAV